MPRSHPPYPPEFRRQMVELVRTGRTPSELALEFELSAESIRNWVKQAEIDEGQRLDGLTTDEIQELARLRRENKQLRLEREIPSLRSGQALAKATAWIAAVKNTATEAGSVPPRSSSS